MKVHISIVVMTNSAGEVAELKLFPSYLEAKEYVRSAYEKDMEQAEEEGRGITGCSLGDDYAWLELDQDESHHWDIFEREIPQEML